jgi:hypothetical protein
VDINAKGSLPIGPEQHQLNFIGPLLLAEFKIRTPLYQSELDSVSVRIAAGIQKATVEPAYLVMVITINIGVNSANTIRRQ